MADSDCDFAAMLDTWVSMGSDAAGWSALTVKEQFVGDAGLQVPGSRWSRRQDCWGFHVRWIHYMSVVKRREMRNVGLFDVPGLAGLRKGCSFWVSWWRGVGYLATYNWTSTGADGFWATDQSLPLTIEQCGWRGARAPARLTIHQGTFPSITVSQEEQGDGGLLILAMGRCSSD
jgi:hypothetical protein